MSNSVWLNIKILAGLNLLLLSIHTGNLIFDWQLYQYGINPRSITTVHHIISAPFIHADVAHLFSNLISLSIFSGLCLLRSISFYLRSSLFILILGGILVWLLGRDASHIGASGWVFGLWSLNIAIAWFDRRFINILIALIVLFFYGGMIYGILPSNPQISFESHLFGTLAGAAYGFIYIRKSKQTAA